jgi:hypothetical protein
MSVTINKKTKLTIDLVTTTFDLISCGTTTLRIAVQPEYDELPIYQIIDVVNGSFKSVFCFTYDSAVIEFNKIRGFETI